MAINLSIELDTGQTVSHHVFDLQFDNVNNQTTLVWRKYVNATKYVNGKTAVEIRHIDYKLKDLPANIKTNLLSVLADVETFMVANNPIFTGGTRVRDNGNPL